MPHKPDGGKQPGEIIRLLWEPGRSYYLHRPETLPCEGEDFCNLTACLTEELLALLRQLCALPLQLQYSPFDTALVQTLNVTLFGDEIEIIE
jgi:hypothetical protein